MTQEIPSKNGVVALIDVLGVGQLSIEDCKQFIVKRDELLNGILYLTKKLTPAISRMAQIPAEPPRFDTFGDTILITWETSELGDHFLIGIAQLLKNIFIISLAKYKLLLRGAISIGVFIRDETTAIGPAIADAAAWYNQADWIGIVATPKAGLRLSAFEKSSQPGMGQEQPLSPWFIEYQVPLISGQKQRLWSLSWPGAFLFKDEDGSQESAFFRELSKYNVQKGTEQKYENTLEFFNYFKKNINKAWWPIEQSPTH